MVSDAELVLTTYDWVPAGPRGYVRDLRIRWALEEAGLPYRMASTPFHDRQPAHFAAQPFGQVPWLADGDVTIFESGAILLYLADRSPALMPADPQGRAQVLEWTIAALNSVEAVTQPCMVLCFAGDDGTGAGTKFLRSWRDKRLAHMETVLAGREWLAGSFSVADLLMADVLRAAERFDPTTNLSAYPACTAYVARATARPAFLKAQADQMAHFARADTARTA